MQGVLQLTLNRKKTSTKLGKKKVEQDLEDVTHFKDVGSGKTDFADVVVPTFDSGAFDAFDAVFAMIEEIIELNSNRGTTSTANNRVPVVATR